MWEAVQAHLARARSEALRMRHPFIGTEHLLLGVLDEEAGLLEQLGLDLAAIREILAGLVDEGPQALSESAQLPFTRRARRALEIAGAQSMQVFDDQVRAEYLLVGLAEEGESVASRVLAQFGLTGKRLREEFRLEPLSPELARRVTSGRPLFERQPFPKLFDLARREASDHQHGFIGTEHLLLAVLDEPEGKGASLLAALGADREKVREAVEECMEPAGTKPIEGAVRMPITPAVKHAMQIALQEAEERGESAISSAHLLVGLAAQAESIAGSVLRDGFGLDADAFRAAL